MAINMDGLSPEEMAILGELMGLDSLLPEEQTAQTKLAQGQGLMAGPVAPHSSGIGAALGGVAHVLDSYRGHKMAQEGQTGLSNVQGRRADRLGKLASRLNGTPFSFDDASGIAGAQFANEYGSGD